MTRSKTLDGIVRGAEAEQTGVRFQYSRFPLQATDCGTCALHPQIVIVEVCKSLGSAANE
ncbi:hypothetical protein SAMN05216475_6292 [Pseudomonas synxantha]|jgi:hypothetical protein|uniref:Uncharacterized protein n=1 Tax=Pseudomonas synxantha TaxID=47883 RepID=A0AAX3HZS2_9PSED|nr:hypothetical protein SAMN05216475_6292 [Pseudomonas synxantha]VTQ88090.1 Uncharacterised protein [Pseudomonas synxantha]